MKIGYARVSTRDQKLDLQVDALNRAGCERIFQDVASGSKPARPALDELPGQLRAGDVLVIWKLDRMGRSLRHLVDLVGDLVARDIGLLSLNDPIDTTSAGALGVQSLRITGRVRARVDPGAHAGRPDRCEGAGTGGRPPERHAGARRIDGDGR
jgi:DNA invertase Pin-like site-specific DNA recombinase